MRTTEKRSIHPPQAPGYECKPKTICIYAVARPCQLWRIRRVFSNNEEDFAARFVRLLGCEVISRNSRLHGAEIDILAKNPHSQEYLLFEVKKARTATFYPAVSHTQMMRLKSAAGKIQQSADRLLTIRVCLLLVDLGAGSIELVPDVVG